MIRAGQCAPCTPIGSFTKTDNLQSSLVKPIPCSSASVTFRQGKIVKDSTFKDCLANKPLDDCGYPSDVQITRSGPDNRELKHYKSAGARDVTIGKEQRLVQGASNMCSRQHNPDESKFPPCYLPQPNDDLSTKDNIRRLEPSGEHEGHSVDYGLRAQRITAADWRMNNRNLLNRAYNVLEETKRDENYCKNTIARAYAIIDKTQAASTQSVRERSHLVTKWKCTLERAIEAMIEEISALGVERIRLKQSLVVLGMPYSIASECLQRRCNRPETERIYDQPEEEMYKEVELIERIRNVFNRTLVSVEAQQVENRKHRQRLEMDWSDKKVSNEIETENVALNNHSTIALFHAGATRFLADQSSEEFWEHSTKEILERAEKCRQDSVALRGTLNGILLNAARDLRSQADAVELAFTSRINCMEEVERRLTNELQESLQELADVENLIVKLTRAIASLDSGMKVAQTRLDDRSHRPNIENCRDATQYSLVEEVGTIQSGRTAMLNALDTAENKKQLLMSTRADLEKEIMLKRRTIIQDRERCMLIRSHFPSATQLSGYAKG